MTKKGTAKKQENSQHKGKKRERHTTFDVVELIREILLRGKRMKVRTVLAEFIANRGTKIVQEALDLAREFDAAPKKLAQIQKSPIPVSVQSIVMGNGLSVASSYLRDMKLNCQVFVVLYIRLLVSAVGNTETSRYMAIQLGEIVHF